MSRTHKDAPGARKSRRARKLAERPFPYTPPAIRVRPLTGLDDAHAEVRAEMQRRFPPAAEDDVITRAELTDIANGF